jgi:hypothetical protein
LDSSHRSCIASIYLHSMTKLSGWLRHCMWWVSKYLILCTLRLHI